MRQATGVARSPESDLLLTFALEHGKRRSVAAQSVLFERGEAARYMFFVLSGRLDVFRKDGKWRVVWSRSEGDAVSFDCDGRRELSCRAATDTELIVVERRVLVERSQLDRELGQRLADLHAEELRIMLSTLGDTSSMKASNVIDLVVDANRSAKQVSSRLPRRKLNPQQGSVAQVSRAVSS